MARGAPKEEENWGCQRPLYRRDDGRAESLWRGPRTGALESIVYVVRRVPDCALAGCVCGVRGSGDALALLSLCGLERVIRSIFLLRVGVCVSRCPHDGFAARE